MWIDEIARHYHHLYPKALGIDVAFRINAEKCGFHLICSKYIDLRNLPNVFVFIPLHQG